MARKLRVYPIKIKEAGEYDCIPDGLWSKGHHDTKQFIETANAWLATQSCDYRHEWLGVHELGPEYESKVTHDWLRFIPNYCDEGVGGYIAAEPHSRGAFPATRVYF